MAKISDAVKLDRLQPEIKKKAKSNLLLECNYRKLFYIFPSNIDFIFNIE